MRWLDYREKLNIGFNDEEKAKYLITNILNNFTDFFDRVSPTNIGLPFCNMVGAKYKSFYNDGVNILTVLESHKLDLWDFISHVIALINCANTYSQYFLKYLRSACDNAALPYDIVKIDNQVFLFPKGALELDDSLVSQPLQWLKAYPKSHTVFCQALKKYSDQNTYDARTIADEFRKSLECFFQEFFKSEKSIENLKSDYGTYLKDKGMPKEVANSIENLLDTYNKYMNNHVKHHDNADKRVLEYIMYQTGNIIRLLITLDNSQTL